MEKEEKKLVFRDLTKDEIDVRVQSCGVVSKDDTAWARLLLYKDARVDMVLLDETVGPENWQREHKELKDNMYCGVSIKFDFNDGFYWVTKWDCGAESNTEKEKGEASDSFKRACVNWGIGRELYTKIPTMVFGLPYKTINNKPQIDGTFEVEKIKIENKEIVALSLLFIKGKNKQRCFVWTKDNGVQQSSIKE